MSHVRLRRILAIAWIAGVSVALYLVIFHREVITSRLAAATTRSMVAGGLVYLVLGSLRGFTLVPATSLVLIGIVFFPPWPLFALTLVGILVSSTSIYYFSEALHLEELLEARHAGKLDRIRGLLDRYGLPVIVVWAFFPLAPTDLVCYLAGVLRIRIGVLLVGVAIGEGAICALYIFLGHAALTR